MGGQKQKQPACQSWRVSESVDCIGDDFIGDRFVIGDHISHDCIGDDCISYDCIGGDCTGDDRFSEALVRDDGVGELVMIAASAMPGIRAT
jgi:hypothetical protein